MKKIATTILAIFFFGICNAQSTKTIVKPDSTQIEKIEKMPMDTAHNKVPLTPLSPKDSIINNKSMDDADPKSKQPK